MEDRKIMEFRRRRAERLESKKKHRYDAVDAFRERREIRLARRGKHEDAGIGWAYGLAKSEGIDTTGMTPKEVFEALEKAGVKSGQSSNPENGLDKKQGENRNAKSSVGNVNNAKGSGDSSGNGSKYTAIFKTNSGVSYPQPKKGAVYDEDTLKEVNRLAGGEQNNPPKARAYDNIVSGMKKKDLTYQRDPDGTVVASIPGLSQMYDKEVKGKSPAVQAAYDKRIEDGRKITQDMIAISDKLGSRMMGLENCFKGGESTSRKIDKVKDKWRAKGEELSDEMALAKMDDVVRFSYKCDHGKMVEQIAGLEKALADHGYEITERDNKFLPKGDGTERDYKAVHLQVKAPNGELFEVQIQSEETIKVKNKNHPLYERSRKLPDGNEEKTRLVRQMIDNWADMADPDGIQELPSFKKKAKAEGSTGKNATVEVNVGGTSRNISKKISDAVDGAKWTRDPEHFGGLMIDVPNVGKAYINTRRSGKEVENVIEVQTKGQNGRQEVTSIRAKGNQRYTKQQARSWLKLFAQRSIKDN